MIVYAATRGQFSEDVFSNQIETRIRDAFATRVRRSIPSNEVDAWKNSMQYMNNILLRGEITEDAGVAIEYHIPQTSKRIDFILTGKDEEKRDTAVIVELKQWTEVKATELDGIVETFIGRGIQETPHPSYQVWTYAALIRDFNEAVQDDRIQLVPCAYLHNCITPEALRADFYRTHLERAPVFAKEDAERLQRFIRQFVRHGDSDRILYRIESGRIRPSKSLADHLDMLLRGNREFLLIDDQKLVYERVLSLNSKAQAGRKQVLIVTGGPGTGKSVVAVNLLVELIRQRFVAHYVTRNAAPRAVYHSKLTQSFQKSHVENLFRNSGSYVESEPGSIDALIVDEAHRLTEKSGLYQNLGENQILELIRSAKLTVFFVDEDQRVTFKDVGEVREIQEWAQQCGAEVEEAVLTSQFRCNGSDAYLSWVEHTLQIRETAHESFGGIDYEFRVFDNPNEMYREIVARNGSANKARLVAGYCWDWKGKKDRTIRDVTIPEHGFAMRWNLGSDGGLWIVKPESVNEVGCIHTCQGLELEYVGVIIGLDLVVRNGEVQTDAAKRAKQDTSVRGYKSMFKADPDRARALADRVIKNTYRTLLSRGQRGCFVYCVDPETNAYFKRRAGRGAVSPQPERGRYPGLTLRILAIDEIRPYENCVPVFDLEVAAGLDFSIEQPVEGYDWVELPEVVRPQRDLFVTQVVGESMNRRIPNGSWCLFKANPGGSRQGRVVIVQHRDIQDAETGTHCTIKVYSSEKRVSADGWRHERITLRPDSNLPGYRPIELQPEAAVELRVVGELVAILC
ncbi:MAG TPA: DNA/RNA helicase domain-containing protein [Candidatus Polarisedimenticolaceae bacterium]|nr:DNA/RNA helicase domain-containing protein [Candidatus Polarisedimenticolaceae bacterium]